MVILRYHEVESMGKIVIRTGRRCDGTTYKYPMKMKNVNYIPHELEEVFVPAVGDDWSDPKITEEGLIDKKFQNIGK